MFPSTLLDQHTRIAPLSTLRFVLFGLIFGTLAVGIPFLAHFVNPMAGPIFLPMHLVIIAGGLLFGWRFGLMLGIVSPTLNFLVTGLPPEILLTQITIEVVAYGLIAGILRAYTRLPLIITIALSMLAGRLILLISLQFLQTPTNPWVMVSNATKTGWPGIVLSLVLLPLILPRLLRWLKKPTNPHNANSASDHVA